MKIGFKSLELETLIGLHDWEREKPMTLYCDCEVEFPYQHHRDDIEDSEDYEKLSIAFRTLAKSKSYFLMESLLEDLKSMVRERVPHLISATIRITKRNILPHAESSSVEDTFLME